jgi:alpha-ketoglutarate-dependent taurine dioxygenase
MTDQTTNQMTPSATVLPRFTGREAWRGADLTERDWRISIPAEALAELAAIAQALDRSPLPTLALDPADYDMPACRAFMARVKHELDRGIRFVVLDRLPVETLGRERATQLYWLLTSLVSRPVAQKHDGTMIFDVWDTGAKFLPGSGVRTAVTNDEQWFHNDNAFNDAPPDYVSLLCLHPARSGGVSRVISLATVHNRLKDAHAAALERLYRPVWFDRQKEHPPGEVPVISVPMFAYDDRLRVRLSPDLTINGYAVKGEPIDNMTADAIETLREMFAEPGLSVELTLRAGEIQLVNNQEIGHSRTAFEDFAEPERRRHLVRLWLRQHGKRSYQG